MALPKLKMSKQLAVGMSVVSTALAGGGYGVSQMPIWGGAKPAAAVANANPAAGKSRKTLTPIAMPAEDNGAMASAPNDLSQSHLAVPSPAETVVRGNDGLPPQDPDGSIRQVQAYSDEGGGYGQGGQYIADTDDTARGDANSHYFQSLPAAPRELEAAETPPAEGDPEFAGPQANEANETGHLGDSRYAIDVQNAAAAAEGGLRQLGSNNSRYVELGADTGGAAAADAAEETGDLTQPEETYVQPAPASAAAPRSPRPSSASGMPQIVTSGSASSKRQATITPPSTNGNPVRSSAAYSASGNGGLSGGAEPAANPRGYSAVSQPRPMDNAFARGGAAIEPEAAADDGAAEGSGVPGPESLDGPQAPALTLEKKAPPEIQVGKPATFELFIRNVGKVAAHDVTVFDQVPRGTRLTNAVPHAEVTAAGEVIWKLESLQPGEEKSVAMHVLPLVEGEIGSVAQVAFATQASARTICTKPELAISHTGPEKVLIGEFVSFDITISNPGSGAATGVVLEENVPDGLSHSEGTELEYDIGTLKPGESKKLRLTLKATKAGAVENIVLLRGEGNLLAQHAAALEVLAPALQVVVRGPKLRYLERNATFEVAIANPGTAPAKEVEIVTYLPKGMKFLSADHKGQYDARNHAVYWSLEELPAQQAGAAQLKLLPQETGVQKLTVEGRAAMGLKQASELAVQVEGLAELQFAIADEADPIEVGNETVYSITLSNSGSSAATNVELMIGLPREMEPISGEGPTKVVVGGDRFVIDPLARIAPGEKTVYKLKVRGHQPGAHRIQVQLISAETPVPVTKEEMTRIYADN